MKYSYGCLIYIATVLLLLHLRCWYYSGLQLRKRCCFVKKMLIIFNFNVLRHSLQNFVLSLFNLTHLTQINLGKIEVLIIFGSWDQKIDS